MIHIRVQYLIDHIIQVSRVEMESLRPWTKADSTLSDSYFAEHLSQSRAHRVDAGKRLLPEFSKYGFGGQLRPINVTRRSFRAIPGNRANGVVKACDTTHHKSRNQEITKQDSLAVPTLS